MSCSESESDDTGYETGHSDVSTRIEGSVDCGPSYLTPSRLYVGQTSPFKMVTQRKKEKITISMLDVSRDSPVMRKSASSEEDFLLGNSSQEWQQQVVQIKDKEDSEDSFESARDRVEPDSLCELVGNISTGEGKESISLFSEDELVNPEPLKDWEQSPILVMQTPVASKQRTPQPPLNLNTVATKPDVECVEDFDDSPIPTAQTARKGQYGKKLSIISLDDSSSDEENDHLLVNSLKDLTLKEVALEVDGNLTGDDAEEDEDEDEGNNDYDLDDSFIASSGEDDFDLMLKGEDESFHESDLDNDENDEENYDDQSSDEFEEEEQDDDDDDSAGHHGDDYEINEKNREDEVRILQDLYNAKVFAGAIPDDFEVSWNTRLRKTAGMTYTSIRSRPNGERVRMARIELSPKVLDRISRLKSTFLHELCHVAAWLVDAKAKPPHGPAFKKWAEIASRKFPRSAVTTCHSYEIHAKFKYECVECQAVFKRHSKSVNIEKSVCGRCKGRIVFKGAFDRSGTPAKPRAPTGFSLFVKDKYKIVREEHGSHGKAMTELSRLWRIEKQKM